MLVGRVVGTGCRTIATTSFLGFHDKYQLCVTSTEHFHKKPGPRTISVFEKLTLTSTDGDGEGGDGESGSKIFGFGRLVWGSLATISEDDSEK